MASSIYNTHAWKKLRAARLTAARTNDEPCCRCGQPINWNHNGRQPDGPTADHLNPISLGGDELPPPHELGVAHRACNERHGSRIAATIRRQTR